MTMPRSCRACRWNGRAGHTTHHQIVRIVSEGRTAVFAADLLPTAAHVDEAWIMAYDLYPMDTLVCEAPVSRGGAWRRVRYLLRARSGDGRRCDPIGRQAPLRRVRRLRVAFRS